jgi:hypothetical protein
MRSAFFATAVMLALAAGGSIVVFFWLGRSTTCAPRFHRSGRPADNLELAFVPAGTGWLRQCLSAIIPASVDFLLGEMPEPASQLSSGPGRQFFGRWDSRRRSRSFRSSWEGAEITGFPKPCAPSLGRLHSWSNDVLAAWPGDLCGRKSRLIVGTGLPFRSRSSPASTAIAVPASSMPNCGGSILDWRWRSSSSR